MSPKYKVENIDPASILGVGCADRLVDGTVTVTLVARYVPLEEIEGLGRVLTLGIGKFLGLDEADSEILARRVVAHLMIEARETLREPGFGWMPEH